MSNKVILFLLAVLLIGAVFVMAKNQKNSTAPAMQEQEVMDDGVVTEENEVLEEGTEDAMEQSEEASDGSRVTVTDSGFEPQSITVKAGSKVVWTNGTQATANVSSAMHPTHELYPPLNLGDFDQGATVELVFDEPGEYKYHDHLNPSKFGTVVVE